MHFIGNRAIVLGDGSPDIQLVYNSGYTVLSVFLPIIGLIIAFSVAELPVKRAYLQWAALILTGTFAGTSIVGMHYVGNFGVTTYKLNYSQRFLAASMIIAVGDCIAVLVLFYKLRERWISSWWKRVLCAAALAGGVSAMHFVASTSCRYEFLAFNSASDITSRDTQVIVAGALCGAAALLVMGAIFVSRARNRLLRSKSQKVMLACAMFDPAGRVLVTTEGVLPSREITDKYNHRTFDDDFDTAHPVFQWIFRVTYSWAGVSELVPKMKSHLSAQKESVMADESYPGSSQASAIYDAETYNNYEILFRERFCTAARSLATMMHMPIEQIGVLYDQVIETGTLDGHDDQGRTSFDEKTIPDIEAALRLTLFGKGQLMFITKDLNEDETNRLLNSGFKFASVQHVSRSIAQAMQIPQRTLGGYLSGLKLYNENLRSTEKSGTYLAFFAMIPKPNGKGFDVAVRKDAKAQLPDVPLLSGRPQAWQAAFLERFDGFKVQQCIDFCEDKLGTHSDRTSQEKQFAIIFKQAVVTLAAQFPPEWRNEARFWAKQLSAHYSHPLLGGSPSTTLYAFTVIGDMHATVNAAFSITRTPRTFFEARHRCYAGSPDHAILARDVHAVFGPLLARRITKPRKHRQPRKLSAALIVGSKASKKGLSDGKTSQESCTTERTHENGSMHELVSRPQHSFDSSPGQPQNDWGGILVNSETVVKTDSKNDEYSHSIKDGRMGIRTDVGTVKLEVTFVDELVTITRERFLPASKAHM